MPDKETHISNWSNEELVKYLGVQVRWCPTDDCRVCSETKAVLAEIKSRLDEINSNQD